MSTDPRVQAILNVPLHRFLGVRVIDPDDPAAGARFSVVEAAQGPGGWLHGGVISALLDMTCYLALIRRLDPGTIATSHAVSVSLLKGVPGGSTVTMRAQIDRLGRTIAFVRAEARADDQLVATGSYTKSLIAG